MLRQFRSYLFKIIRENNSWEITENVLSLVNQAMQTLGNKANAMDPPKNIIYGTLNRNLSTFIAWLGPVPV